MVRTAKSIAVAAALALGACGGAAPDFTVHGAGIVVRSDAAFTKQADFPSRVETTVEAALTYWGGSWKHLQGKTISFYGSQHVPCGDNTGAVGCYDGDIRVSTRDIGLAFYCVEETTLVHEVGHAVVGDPGHTDPRWMDFAAVQQLLTGRTGYGDRDELPCDIFVSVWRHPPDRHPDN